MSGSEGGVYFLSRSELLAWVNNLLQLSYTKVEECCSGAAHCQIMDAVYPGKVPMSKVNFASKLEYEHVNNYKILQKVCDKLGVDKYIDVNKLIKGKYQDNLEFLQWMKGFFDKNYSGQPYDAVARRSKSKGVPKGRPRSGAPKAASSGDARRAASQSESPSEGSGAAMDAPVRVPLSRRTNAGPGRSAGKVSSAALDAANAKVTELEEENMELKLSVDGLERERDFYFGKLRDIEIMCQSPDRNLTQEEFVAQVTKILYATEDDFVCPDELEKENGDDDVVEKENDDDEVEAEVAGPLEAAVDAY